MKHEKLVKAKQFKHIFRMHKVARVYKMSTAFSAK